MRIIAGRWRGRRLRFPADAGIRPTPDRVRETLFNWLQGVIGGARCLDLFAGSGALGIEALSRGADSVVLVERNPRVAGYLRDTLALLDTGAGEVQQAEATAFLRHAGRRFDVVFLDPPFLEGALAPLLEALACSDQLAPGALVYIEHAARFSPPPLPAGFEVRRSKRAGEVGYHLLAWRAAA
ncbi:MAG TPA: 16S rRNA (guanine(966)-N(2))-methyltransferase RsmD [Gammaproteobacteria bacterium]|nr:16S rRNA (guanine(966)-N(2))-methyltransferase RsmD [Gammaproteobacteria bacterium]